MTTGQLAPSIIAADFARLGEQLGAVEPWSHRWHVDAMDGHYVPNLTIGPMVVGCVARVSSLPQDLHLMVSNPDQTWEWYAKAGADRIAFHPETVDDPADLLRRISGAGLGAGLAINPDVAPRDVAACASAAGHLVIMSVYPSFSGQAFIAEVLPKFGQFREALGGDVQMIIDGGVGPETAAACVAAGADVLVSASAIFGSTDPAAAARDLAGYLT